MHGMDAVISFLGHALVDAARRKEGGGGRDRLLASATTDIMIRQLLLLRLEIPEISCGEDGDGDEGADEADDAKGREKYPLEPELDSVEGL